MTKLYLCLFMLFWLQTTIADTNTETKLLRYPDIHSDTVVFVYGGDIWTAPVTGGLARRVTAHPGEELFPKFSPDGKWIAFTGQYDGDDQVYIIPSTGGTPKRITAYPSAGAFPARWGVDNQVVGWSPSGDSVLFRSHRKQISIVYSRLYTASINGGLPEPLPMIKASTGVFSPDGSKVLYSPEARDFRSWKRYRGGWAKDLWIFDLKNQQARNVTEYEGTDRDPIWSNKGIYFVSERDGSMDLYSLDDQGHNLHRITNLKGDVRWASGDLNGNVVYEYQGQLRIYSAAGKHHSIHIQVPDDGTHTRPHYVAVKPFIENGDLSPSGKRIALTARGDIFSAPLEKGVYRNLTHSDSHERLGTWSPSGKSIAYVSDATGEEQVWVVDEVSGKQRQITKTLKRRYYSLSWSPNEKQLAAGDQEGNLYVIDIKSGKSQKVGDMGAWYHQNFSWSPDGQYLAYSATDTNFLSSIFIWSQNTGSKRLTSEFNSEFSPAWHNSGKYLYFLADRSFAPQMGHYEWNYAVNRETVVLGVALTNDTPNPFAPTDDLATESSTQASEAKLPGKTTIQWQNINDRMFLVPMEADNYSYLFLRDNTLLLGIGDAYYMGRNQQYGSRLISYSIPDQEKTVIAKNINDADIKHTEYYSAKGIQRSAPANILIYKNGSVVSHNLNDGTRQHVDLSYIGKTVNPKLEWANSFDETWRRFRDFFYVENMHGYDWTAIGNQYRKLLPHVSHRADLNYLIGEMIAELNVGHAYTFGGDSRKPTSPPAALLGASFKLDKSAQRYQIVDILKGNNSFKKYRSPLTELGVNISEGEYLLAINGVDLTAENNPYDLLRYNHSPSGLVSLTVSTNANGKNSKTLLVKPLVSEQPLYYYNWVEANRRTVAELSNNRIGYLHIPDMSSDGIQEFIRSYYGQIRKDALIIDVRSNLGGNISQMILERLERKAYSLGFVRGEKNTRIYPWGSGGSKVFTGKLAVLADETTMSDGEAFTWTFKQAKLGPVIGRRTWGGVVGTDDTGPTVDGGAMRVPQFALADINRNWVVEGTGVIPDIDVKVSPMDSIAGRDPQLERALQELTRELKGTTPGILPTQKPAAPNKTPNQKP